MLLMNYWLFIKLNILSTFCFFSIVWSFVLTVYIIIEYNWCLLLYWASKGNCYWLILYLYKSSSRDESFWYRQGEEIILCSLKIQRSKVNMLTDFSNHLTPSHWWISAYWLWFKSLQNGSTSSSKATACGIGWLNSLRNSPQSQTPKFAQ